MKRYFGLFIAIFCLQSALPLIAQETQEASEKSPEELHTAAVEQLSQELGLERHTDGYYTTQAAWDDVPQAFPHLKYSLLVKTNDIYMPFKVIRSEEDEAAVLRRASVPKQKSKRVCPPRHPYLFCEDAHMNAALNRLF